MTPFWKFNAKSEDAGELLIYGEISETTWMGDEVTPKQFKKDLDALGDIKSLNIYINSGGGDVFAGQAIHSMLKRHSAKKTVYIDGLAASIASVIAMAGDRIVMPRNAMMMVHHAWTIAIGMASDLRKTADTLERIDGTIVGVYADRTGLEADKVIELMDAETWMTADDAVAHGFADEVEQGRKIAASIVGGALVVNGQTMDLSRYHNAPAIAPDAEPEPPAVEPDPETNDSGGVSRPVSDPEPDLKAQTHEFNRIRSKLYEQ